MFDKNGICKVPCLPTPDSFCYSGRYHISMHHHLCGFPIQKILNSANTVEMVICHATHMLYMALRASSKKTPMFLATVEVGTMVLTSSICGMDILLLM